MSVRITDVSQHVTVDVRLNVEATDDTTDLRPDYSSVESKRFRPNILRVTYYQTQKDPSWKVSTCEVTGYIVKKDGTLSDSATGKARMSTYGARKELEDHAPSWVRDMVESATPVPFTWAD